MTALHTFLYLLPAVPTGIGIGRWLKDEPDFRHSPGFLGFAVISAGLIWPLVLALAVCATVCVVIGELVRR